MSDGKQGSPTQKVFDAWRDGRDYPNGTPRDGHALDCPYRLVRFGECDCARRTGDWD